MRSGEHVLWCAHMRTAPARARVAGLEHIRALGLDMARAMQAFGETFARAYNNAMVQVAPAMQAWAQQVGVALEPVQAALLALHVDQPAKDDPELLADLALLLAGVPTWRG